MPIEVLMPALSPTMEEGTLASWLVKEGDEVKSGDVIAEIETDKATMEVEAVDEGVLGKILVEAGTEGVKVNAVIALLLEEGEDKSALEGAGSGGSKSSKSETAEKSDPPSVGSADTSPAGGGGKDAQASKDDASSSSAREGGSREAAGGGKGGSDRIKASPLARRLAEQAGLKLADIDGSGPGGRIIKRDVEAASKDAPKPKSAARDEAPRAPEPARAEISEDEPLARYGIAADRYELRKADGITKISAKRLTESFRDVPHFPLNVDCRLDALLAFRKQVNDKAPDGVKVSVNDILIKASGLALKRVPEANASWIEDGRIALHKHADVSVAVAIEGGLITPIIFDADAKGLIQISSEMKDLAARARERKLKPEEFQGGTFSLSNLGMFGIKSFASILNPPQGMILSIGAGEERAVITDGAIAKATVMTVTLTCDHRVVDGATGARWITAFKGFIEDPVTMLM
ncbi:pyruvate dehydrogenase complex dihydrolipoamide acetyltransferase [Alkalicaulis satelles]|uniref:Acetyltransferase component of pyruvate dehydrogenase complex n=1 Tax=Alkalicaulis satelles TaxID=2609175 RepID=A0A5M6ZJ84_9PROT|nr:pyruvate dehydrogenase complex dihydrolipoamide acetyltransferase [Alkalicaulis satelles]KAA5804876.1 pyruvate dehydrogenase complex dihydrolipoamide acetyltransferase [Alkalicaulis satelles]